MTVVNTSFTSAKMPYTMHFGFQAHQVARASSNSHLIFNFCGQKHTLITIFVYQKKTFIQKRKNLTNLAPPPKAFLFSLFFQPQQFCQVRTNFSFLLPLFPDLHCTKKQSTTQFITGLSETFKRGTSRHKEHGFLP